MTGVQTCALPISTSAGDSVPFRFKVENREYLGSEWIVSGTLVGGKFEGKEIFSRLPSAQDVHLDDICDFVVPQRELKFFDPVSEKRVEPRALSWH